MCRRFVKTFAGLFAFSICSLSACLSFRSVGMGSCASSGAGNCCIRCLPVETGEINLLFFFFFFFDGKRESFYAFICTLQQFALIYARTEFEFEPFNI